MGGGSLLRKQFVTSGWQFEIGDEVSYDEAWGSGKGKVVGRHVSSEGVLWYDVLWDGETNTDMYTAEDLTP
jgi:hypothetical protein